MHKFIFLAFLFVVPAFGQNQTSDAFTSAGCGPKEVSFQVKVDKNHHATGQVAPQEALIYIFNEETRDSDITYIGAPTIRVGVDGTWVGANSSRSYFFFALPSGEHRLCVAMQGFAGDKYHASAASAIAVDLGKTYYFRTITERRQKREPGVKLESIDSAEGSLAIANCGLAVSHPKK